ncbi:SDR family NAD(P)-dependent oxidoreductase [Pseudomonas sp. UBA2684]|uniref:SDR family NAD(P)-dependent oxidoreductase n=1 Tax=Pseudomonas sp. UBA2684 TaxID=1947311 RepID=UPI0025F1F0C3|nr:SDR family NAD(P)-dependent oxidoreductase [Pseudomonas sp. UBA2684]|tara:strand:+ start:8520 stop:9263 length:744 start_codon:yes stop_codon:yes gene_type:complete
MDQAKRYLLTGASSGIGAALARELAGKGYDLALAARREDHLHLLAAELKARFGRNIVVLPLDVTDYAACQDAVGLAANALGGLDGVIANAGIALTGKAGGGHFERARLTLETNLIGAIACLDAAAALFRQQGHGHLVAVASVAGKRGLPHTAAYSASKAGLISYMESTRTELLGKGIDTSLILPGFIDTPLNREMASRPFLIDVERGAALIAKHIDKRHVSAYVPGWPWAVLGRLLPLLPTSIIAKF